MPDAAPRGDFLYVLYVIVMAPGVLGEGLHLDDGIVVVVTGIALLIRQASQLKLFNNRAVVNNRELEFDGSKTRMHVANLAHIPTVSCHPHRRSSAPHTWGL